MSSDMSDSSKKEMAANLAGGGKPGDTHVVPPGEVAPLDAGKPTAGGTSKMSEVPVGGDYGMKEEDEEKDDDPTFKSTAGGAVDDEDKDSTDGDDASKGSDDDSDEGDLDESAGGSGSDDAGSGGGKPPAPPSGGDDGKGKDDDKSILLTRINEALAKMVAVREGVLHTEALDKKLAEATYLLEPLLIGPITDDELTKIKERLFVLVGEIEIEAAKLTELKSRKTLERATDVINRVKKKHGL